MCTYHTYTHNAQTVIIIFTLACVNMYACMLHVGTIIEGLNNVIYIPGQTPLPIELTCNITGLFVTWEVDNVTYTIGNINGGRLVGHRASGINILVDVPMNNTKYICVSNNETNVIGRSEPAFLYVAGV